MAQRRFQIGITQQARDFAPARCAGHYADVARGDARLGPFCDDEMMIGAGRDLWQVRDHEYLPGRRRHLPQRLAEAAPDGAAHALIDLVEHERRHRIVLRQRHFQREHQAGQLAP
jgi:hypothetical protein